MPNFTLFERKPLIWFALVVPVCLRDRGNAKQVEGAVLCAGRGGEDGDEAIALDNAMRRQFAPKRGYHHAFGVRRHKAGRPARITPCDLCRIVSHERQPA